MSKSIVKTFDSSIWPTQNNVRCKPGVLVAAPYKYDQSDRVIIDAQFQNGREGFTDCGVVLASGVDGYSPGDIVVYPPFCGLWIKNCAIGKHVFADVIVLRNDERFKRTVTIGKVEGERLLPHGGKVLCVADELPGEQNGILLVESAKRWTGRARVLEVSGSVDDVEVGECILYDFNNVKQLSVDDAISKFYECDKERMFFIDSSDILAVV